MAGCRSVQVRRLDRATLKKLSCATSLTPAFDRPPAHPRTDLRDPQHLPPTACGLATFSAVVDGDRRWADGVAAAVGWFRGENDGQLVMWDPQTGRGSVRSGMGTASRSGSGPAWSTPAATPASMSRHRSQRSDRPTLLRSTQPCSDASSTGP